MEFVGTVLIGFCQGIFSRDCPNWEKRIEAVGTDWIVARDDEGRTYFASFKSHEIMVSRITEIVAEIKLAKENEEPWAL